MVSSHVLTSFPRTMQCRSLEVSVSLTKMYYLLQVLCSTSQRSCNDLSIFTFLPKTVCTPPSQVTSEIMIATNWIYNSHVRHLQVNALGEWIIGIYLHEFTNNEREISIPHEAAESRSSRPSRPSRRLLRHNPGSRGTNQPIRKSEFVQCMKVE